MLTLNATLPKAPLLNKCTDDAFWHALLTMVGLSFGYDSAQRTGRQDHRTTVCFPCLHVRIASHKLDHPTKVIPLKV